MICPLKIAKIDQGGKKRQDYLEKKPSKIINFGPKKYSKSPFPTDNII